MDMIISEKFDFVNEGVGDFFKGILEKIKEALKAIKEFFQGLIQKIKEKFNKGKCEANKKAVDSTVDKWEEKLKEIQEKEKNPNPLQKAEKKYKELAIEKYKERFSSYFDDFSDIAVVWIPTGAVFKVKVEGYKDYFVREADKYIRDPFKYQIDLDASKNFEKMTGGFFGEFEGLVSGANPSKLSNSEGNYGRYTAKDIAHVLYSDGYNKLVSKASSDFPIDFKKVESLINNIEICCNKINTMSSKQPIKFLHCKMHHTHLFQFSLKLFQKLWSTFNTITIFKCKSTFCIRKLLHISIRGRKLIKVCIKYRINHGFYFLVFSFVFSFWLLLNIFVIFICSINPSVLK
jgi:hypothetical protein